MESEPIKFVNEKGQARYQPVDEWEFGLFTSLFGDTWLKLSEPRRDSLRPVVLRRGKAIRVARARNRAVKESRGKDWKRAEEDSL